MAAGAIGPRGGKGRRPDRGRSAGAPVRFGLFSDVHGNLAGLRAVFAALDREGPLDYVVAAGDHLQGGPRPREVWEALGERGCILIRGNEDLALLSDESDVYRAQSPYRSAFEKGLAWTRARIGPDLLGALAALPDQWRVSTPAGDLLVVHASPRSIHDRVGGAHNTAAEVAAAYSGTGAGAIVFGHYHRNFVRVTPFALLINVASVSLPVDPHPLAAYTILTASTEGWIVEQRQVPYDASEEVAIARERQLPPWLPDPAD